jgi:hypothetical protein
VHPLTIYGEAYISQRLSLAMPGARRD